MVIKKLEEASVALLDGRSPESGDQAVDVP